MPTPAPTKPQHVTILGAGDMGHGVAQLAAMHGYDVSLRDVDEAQLERAHQRIEWSLTHLAGRGHITEADARAALDRIHVTLSAREALRRADLVIEAVPEDPDLKCRVLQDAARLAPSHAILASNTSAIAIGELAEGLEEPARLVGMHFFNPVLLMDLIEIIPGPDTSPQALEAVETVARSLGRTTITLQHDSPGFVTSRLIGTWMNAALWAHEAIGAEPELIDAALRDVAGFPMGPFEVMDYTGLDVCHHAATYTASRLGEHHAPRGTLTGKVEAGNLGRKTGRGFYTWKEGKRVEPLPDDARERFDPAFILAITANEAFRVLAEGVASEEEIDLAMRKGCGFPVGPLAWARGEGLGDVRERLEGMFRSTGDKLAEPAEALGAS